MLRILNYNRIAELDEPSELDPTLVSATPDAFRAQMVHLARRYTPVSFEDVLDAFTGGRSLPARAVHVTFDDGYRDFADVAWPILRELGIPATLFVPTAYPGSASRAFWWDRMHRAVARGRRASDGAPTLRVTLAPNVGLEAEEELARARTLLRDRPHDETELLVDRICESFGSEAQQPAASSAVLSWDDLRRLRREGVAVGTHTHHHVALPRVAETRMRWEIRRSMDELLRELGQAPAVLSYPYGMVDADVVRMAREEGCVLGFSCMEGLNRPGETHPLLLRRTCITPRVTPALFPFRLLPWFAAWPAARGFAGTAASVGAAPSSAGARRS